MRRFRPQCSGHLFQLVKTPLVSGFILWFHSVGEGERTRAGIRVQHGNAMLAGPVLEKALLRAIVGRAGQSGQINQQRDLGDGLVHGLWWQIQVEVHLAVGGFGRVAGFEQLAPERGNRCFCCHGHFCFFLVSSCVYILGGG